MFYIIGAAIMSLGARRAARFAHTPCALLSPYAARVCGAPRAPPAPARHLHACRSQAPLPPEVARAAREAPALPHHEPARRQPGASAAPRARGRAGRWRHSAKGELGEAEAFSMRAAADSAQPCPAASGGSRGPLDPGDPPGSRSQAARAELDARLGPSILWSPELAKWGLLVWASNLFVIPATWEAAHERAKAYEKAL